MCFKREKIGEIEIVTLSGRLDTEKAQKIDRDFDDLTESGSGKTLVIMDRVDYISSSLIRVLLRSLKRHRARNGDIQLVGLQPRIKSVLKVAGMDALFVMHDNREDGVKSFE